MPDFFGAVIGESGNVQLDTRFPNLPRLSTGSFSSLTAINPSYYGQTVQTHDSEVVAACALHPNTNAFSTVGYGYTDGVRDKVLAMSSGSATFDYATYSLDLLSNVSGYGLATYDEDGNVTYWSGNRYLKICDIVTVDPDGTELGSSPDDYVDISHSVTSPYYLPLVGRMCIPTMLGSLWGAVHLNLGLKALSSTSVRVGWFAVNRTGPVSGSPFAGWVDYPVPLRLAICQL